MRPLEEMITLRAADLSVGLLVAIAAGREYPLGGESPSDLAGALPLLGMAVITSSGPPWVAPQAIKAVLSELADRS
jgi:hypothetical protein